MISQKLNRKFCVDCVKVFNNGLSKRLHEAKFSTMRAAVVDKHGQSLRVTDIPIPEPGHGEVPVKIHASGVW